MKKKTQISEFLQRNVNKIVAITRQAKTCVRQSHGFLSVRRGDRENAKTCVRPSHHETSRIKIQM
uniref:Uncharacterized protein n=1 Tax=Ipomoea trifida TaxID=35884 RepID=A0A949_IPOTF|nr:hypothetical protein [Ipomoea trifida]